MKLIKLNKTILNLIDNVSLPFAKELLNSENGKKYFNTEEKQFQFILDIVKLSIRILIYPALYLKLNQTNEEIYDDIKEFLNRYFYNAIKVMQKKEEIKNKLNGEEEAVIKEVEEIEDEEFFDFDSEVFDEEINNMHYEEHQKISAKEFMQENSFDNSLLDDLDEKLDEYYNIIEIKESLNQEDLEKVKKIFSFFAYIFNLSGEFRDIAFAFEKLNQFLENFDVSDENKSKMLKMFLDTIIDDLIKFKKEVFEDMSANDIHYLDASLLANISQIEISFSSLNSNEEDDDIFF